VTTNATTCLSAADFGSASLQFSTDTGKRRKFSEQRVKSSGNRVQLPGHTVNFPEQPVERPEHSVQFPGKTIKHPEHGVEFLEHAVEFPGKTVKFPGRTEKSLCTRILSSGGRKCRQVCTFSVHFIGAGPSIRQRCLRGQRRRTTDHRLRLRSCLADRRVGFH
jgi:hypothetical protein